MIRPIALLAVLSLSLTAPALAKHIDRGPMRPLSPEQRDERLHVGAVWGQMLSSQLLDEEPTSYWNVHMNVPIFEKIGLSTQLRMDNIVFGDPNQILSLLVHPGRTDYSIGARLMPEDAWLGIEGHHVSSHEVRKLHDSDDVAFEPEVREGEASNFGAFIFRWGDAEMRLGYGSLWVDTNTAPILLDLEGYMLNTRSAEGPLATLRLPVRHFMGLSGHISGMYVHDERPNTFHSTEGDYAAWGASLMRPINGRWTLGLGYQGNLGRQGFKRLDNSASAFVRLRWGLD